MNERRLARLSQQIKQRLAQVLQREIADPKMGMVTITRIELDSEFTQCKAYWSVLAGSDQEERARRDSAAALNRARGFCQREMAKALHTRLVPHLHFLFDEGISATTRMNKILAEISDSSSKPTDGECDSTTGKHSDAPEDASNQHGSDDADSDAPNSD